jgi:predicted nucleic acid-binding protein
MLSIDTNILLPGVLKSSPRHAKAVRFLESHQERSDVVISEFILLELYILLRNPTVMPVPLSAVAAVETCQAFRKHPKWQICGFPPNSAQFHEAFWPRLTNDAVARRRAFDCRTALALQQFGVDEFATENLKDFEGFGFSRVWNPIR